MSAAIRNAPTCFLTQPCPTLPGVHVALTSNRRRLPASVLPEPTEPANRTSRAGQLRNSDCFGVGSHSIGRCFFALFVF
jgi:hypothetical protein